MKQSSTPRYTFGWFAIELYIHEFVVKVVEIFFNNRKTPFYRWSPSRGSEILDEMFRSEIFDFEDIFYFISSIFGSDNFCRNVIKVPRLTRDNNHDYGGFIR